MARARSAESPRTRSKTAAIDEIAQGLATFQNILTSIEDFSREGFPYRDGARAKTELQIRETVRRLFGERSPEYQAHRAHKLKISTSTETTQSVHLVKSFIAALEHKKLELQGLAPATPTPAAGQRPTPSSPPQMTIVPPSPPSDQIAMAHESTQGSTPPVIMPVASTANLSQPPVPTPQTPALEALPPMPASRQEPVAAIASPLTAQHHVIAPPQPQADVFASSVAASPPATSIPTHESNQTSPGQPSAPDVAIAAPPASPVPPPNPTPAASRSAPRPVTSSMRPASAYKASSRPAPISSIRFRPKPSS